VRGTCLFVVGLLLLVASGCGSSAPTDGGDDTGRVATVSDGDTLRLDDGRRVRLVQIDAPEAGRECWGDDAARALRALVPVGTTVTLERDPALDDRDRFGRLLRYVSVAGRNLNVELVRSGAAAPYFFRGERGRHAGELVVSAKAARGARRGLWGACSRARLVPGRTVATGAR